MCLHLFRGAIFFSRNSHPFLERKKSENDNADMCKLSLEMYYISGSYIFLISYKRKYISTY